MKRALFLLVILLPVFDLCPAQVADTSGQVVYLIGNTASPGFREEMLAGLREQIRSEKTPFSLVHLGDLVAPGEKGQKGDPDEAQARLGSLLTLTGDREDARLVFTPGDMDWDNSGREGLAMVRKLEEELSARRGHSTVFLPSEGCPGPEVIDLSPVLRLVVLSTQWWMHPFDIPEAPDADCSNLTKEEVIEELEEIIEESSGMNILIIGHHPVSSAGVYGGHMTLETHLFPLAETRPGNRVPLPVIGSFHAAYRQNVGTVRDMASEQYREFIEMMDDLFTRHPGLVYASAHDYSLQLLEFGSGFQVISGSIGRSEPTGRETGSLFSASDCGFARLEYLGSGEIRISFFQSGPEGSRPLYSRVLFRSGCGDQDSPLPVNRYYIPCLEEKEEAGRLPGVPFPSDSALVAGGDYPAKGLKRVLLGSLHRETWQTPVSIPYLNLDTAKAGLTPFALGGGRQTTTLKFKAGDGLEYAFRSVDKSLVNALPKELRNTFVGMIIKEVTATEYPYGAIIASSLMDEAGILHARPKLYVLPDHPGLGAFREPFAGLFGMLEIRPGDPHGEQEGFMGADDVTRSAGLFRKLYRDNDVHVDAETLGEARVFDMLIGDWGRHEDNWKWAGYDREDQRVYYPIPRDRDHAFCRWNGLIPYLADREWAMPMVESFEAEFRDIKSLTWPARHLDRLLLTGLDQEEWRQIASTIGNKMTDEAIDRAVRSLPPEILSVSGNEIGAMLKSRRDQLPEAVEQYYSLLARQVDVVGSNKHEFFEVERLPDGHVHVAVYKKKKEGRVFTGEPLYEREFDRKETREICLYGLDGTDVFEVSGTAVKSIPVRIIGGPGPDVVTDRSNVRGISRHTLIYDTKSTSLHTGPESRDLTSDKAGINLYDRTAFQYNTYLPKPLIYYSSDDGFVGSFSMNWTRHGFRKVDYASRHDLYLRGGTVGNIQVGMHSRWKGVVGRWDGGIKADYGHYFPYYNYFGLGNSTEKDPDLFETDHYKVYLKGLLSGIYAENEIFPKGTFRVGLHYEDINVRSETDSIFDREEVPVPGADRVSLGGINARFYLDFRDREIFATRGLQFLLENSGYLTMEGASGNFGHLETYVKYFGTARILIPVSLVVKLGGSKTYGGQIPFYKYPHLGQFSNLRGYRRNRFTGDASAYVNSELRFHFGKVRNLVLPFETGLIAFFDTGRVWMNGNGDGGWHPGYGGGLYISPLTRDYLFTLMFESSPEEKVLFRFGFGFMLDDG